MLRIVKTKKRYRVSRELDLHVDYYVTKTDNARYEAQEDGDFELLDVLESKFALLLDLQEDLQMDEEGIFTVSSKYYVLACECRDMYRALH